MGNEAEGQKKANEDDFSLMEVMIVRGGENNERVNKQFSLQTTSDMIILPFLDIILLFKRGVQWSEIKKKVIRISKYSVQALQTNEFPPNY